MKVVAIVQARMASVRFPGKVMHSIGGLPMIQVLLERLARSRRVHDIILATSDGADDAALADFVRRLNYLVFRGDERDVLNRFFGAAKTAQADIVVRITGDCPLVDPGLVDAVISMLLESGADYASNVDPPTFPDGLDVEALTFAALERTWREAASEREREHVTLYLREGNRFERVNLKNKTDESRERWTVDEPDDAKVINRIFEHFAPRRDFAWAQVLELRDERPEIFESNKHLTRNAGAETGTGQKLWGRAKRVIPGGNMLLSKRAEMFLPEQWPTYFSKARGCRVWDLDGREYVDMSLMGIGTNTLGYGHPEVDDAVRTVVAMGNMSTLNCPEEVYLAERLVELHRWADMVRLARSGGEANAIAIRIARAAAGRDKVAICGYHGWHDWYLAANLGDERNLAGHLLPGLEPKGVPQHLRGSVLPFLYNDFETLEALVEKEDLGVVKMEVSRSSAPNVEFLRKVRELTRSKGIVLVFDECTSGFRQSFGGLHKLYGVEPDMAVFGKTLGNGYAITAVLGRREVMEAAQSTFISSTFWTERIGPAAALKTLDVMGRVRSWETITSIGEEITRRWGALAQKYDVPVRTQGLPALTGMVFDSDNALAYKTLITQEMLGKGFLASTNVYACVEHSREIIDHYFEALEPVFGLIKECEQGRDVNTLLRGPICHSGFRRLN